MKKYINVLIKMALCLLVVTGCSSDDNSSVGITGTWVLSSFSFGNNYDLNNDGQALSNLLEETGCNLQDRIEFNSDGTGAIVDDGSSLDVGTDFIVTDTGSEIIITDIYDFDCYIETDPDFFNSINFSWEETDSNTVTLMTAFGENLILDLSGNTLTEVVPNAYEIPVIIDGELTNDTSIEDVILVYTKQ